MGKNAATRANTSSFNIVQACSNGDIFSLGFADSAESGGDNARLLANTASFTIRRIDV